MKPQAYQKPTIYNSDGTKAQTGTYDIRTDPLTNSTADGILDYVNNNLEALNAKDTTLETTLKSYVDSAIKTANSSLMHSLYPVGSYIYSDKSANPSTYLPYMSDTTWTQTSQGRVLVGAGTGTDANNTAKTFAAGSTGGEYTHKLTVDEMPENAVCFMPNTTTSPIDNIRAISDSRQTIGPSPSGFATNVKVKLRFDGMPIPQQSNANVTQPYTAVYIWKRTK